MFGATSGYGGLNRKISSVANMAGRPNGFSGAFARVLKFWPFGGTVHRYAPCYNAF